MNIKSGVLSFLLFLFSYCVFSGGFDSIGVTKINDKLHVRYLVSPGETIYGISTKYGVQVSDLMELNPELENGLKVGQVINIPYNPQAIKQPRKNDDNLIVHKVAPGETFYSLSRKYNVSIDDLMRMNNVHLRSGQEIVVGFKNQAKPNTPVASGTPAPNNTAGTPVPGASTQPKENPVTAEDNSNVKPVEKNKAEESKNIAKAPETKPAPSAQGAAPGGAIVSGSNAVTSSGPSEADNSDMYPYDPSKKQVLVIPFDPYLYFSDADDEIAARSNMPRPKVRQVFRKRLNAMLEAPAGYETIRLLGGKAKDSLSDMNKIYSMVSYNYQKVVESPYYQEEQPEVVMKKNNKNWLEKQKDRLMHNETSTANKYNIPQELSEYFGVVIKNPDFWTYFNSKYNVDYYIFVSQFEVKTNYEHCLDRAAQNYDRTFTTHYSIFDNTGKQISGNKFKTHYNSNSNNIYTIVADNVEKIAQRILKELPPPSK